MRESIVILWKHPDTAAPEEYASLPICDDEQHRLECVTLVSPDSYVEFIDGQEWTFAVDKDGAIRHVPVSDCNTEADPTEWLRAG